MQHRFISYIDLMCCGFGGALLMFLIVASAKEPRIPAQPMLVVRYRATIDAKQEAVMAHGAELGIEYRRVRSRNWIRVNGLASDEDLVDASDDKASFLPLTAPHQPMESVAIFRNPRPGQWEFRAYLADFPSDSSNSPISVECEILGAHITRPAPSLLTTPGTTTQIVLVDIPAKK